MYNCPNFENMDVRTYILLDGIFRKAYVKALDLKNYPYGIEDIIDELRFHSLEIIEKENTKTKNIMLYIFCLLTLGLLINPYKKRQIRIQELNNNIESLLNSISDFKDELKCFAKQKNFQ